ncbi:hypothetical protein A2U01_0106789, partial [Trifolium medium]|nr:hypothetical protein [Trifolium medium]
MDAIFSHVPVAPMISAVFAPIHVRLRGNCFENRMPAFLKSALEKTCSK